MRDNGPGIPQDQLDHIFESFHQVSDEHRGKPEGSGLGLTISQRIVEHHGGRIRATSTLGESTSFYFIIPRQQQAAGKKRPESSATSCPPGGAFRLS